jgi:hypothetical protein
MTSESNRVPDRGHHQSTRWFEVLIGAAAILISAVSVVLALSANRTQERLLAASTWPYLQYGTGNRADDGSDVINLSLTNAGVGPALIKWVQVIYAGQPRRNAADLIVACCKEANINLTTITSNPSVVLAATDSVTPLRLPRDKNDNEVWERFNRERFKVRVQACYCSVLGQCWLLDTTRGEPEALDQCPAVPPEQQFSG